MAVCQQCGDRGIYLVGEVAVHCKCMRQRALWHRMKVAQLSEPMRRLTFDRFELRYYARDLAESGRSYYDMAQTALGKAAEFTERVLTGGKADGLLLIGPVGSGKTFLACCIANRLLDEGVDVLFLVVPDYLDRLRATYDSQHSEYTEIDLTDAAKSAPVLILDDLGAHHYTDWSRQKIYSLLNHRLNHGLPVVATTNISVDDLGEYLGERTTSRLVQLCRPVPLLREIDIRFARRRAEMLDPGKT